MGSYSDVIVYIVLPIDSPSFCSLNLPILFNTHAYTPT